MIVPIRKGFSGIFIIPKNLIIKTKSQEVKSEIYYSIQLEVVFFFIFLKDSLTYM